MKLFKTIAVLLASLFILPLLSAQPAAACGGLFCQNVPVDQAAERIIFTVDPGQVTAYVQINYIGNAPDFAWVVPVPAVPAVDVVEIAPFNELQAATNPVFLVPPTPNCMFEQLERREGQEGFSAPTASPMPTQQSVTVFASGEAGPYAFDVVGTETGDSQALINWLNENNYRITPEMEPLVMGYVEAEMLFLAMKLQPEQGVQNIQPVKMTYPSDRPRIPIRLTAVAAVPNMGIYTWIYGRTRAESLNYASIEVDDADISLANFFNGSTNYQPLIAGEIDRFGGLAFVTEYAQPAQALPVVDPLLQQLRQQYPYITRFYGQLSPNEMTVDPVFDFNNDLAGISNIHDLTERDDLYPCSDQAVDETPVEEVVEAVVENIETTITPAPDSNIAAQPAVVDQREDRNTAIVYALYGAIGAVLLLGLGAILGGSIAMLTRRKS